MSDIVSHGDEPKAPKSMNANAIWRWIATCSYAGYAPIAPGTAGSAVAVPMAWVVQEFGSLPIAILVIAVSYVIGVRAASVVEQQLGDKDPSMVVVDEWVGMLITVVGISLSGLGFVLGFLLFRLMDIIKPFPGRRAESIPGGTGIMLDDVVAGVYAHLVLRVAVYAFPDWLLA